MESQQVKAHIPCPHCGSKDNATEYTDHYYCFGCEKRWSKSEEESSTVRQTYVDRKPVVGRGSFRDLPDRCLTESTCKKFGVSSLKTAEGIVEHYYPYYNKEGKFTALKTRKTQTKEFSWEGDSRECMLFGQQLFAKGGRYVTICEGECFKGDTEVLTPTGWVKLESLKDEKVLQVDDKGCSTFVTPICKIQKPYKGVLLSHKQKNYSICATEGHNIVYYYKGKEHKKPFKDVPWYYHIPLTTHLKDVESTVSDDELRLIVAISADGTIDTRKDGRKYVRISFKKQRKIERLEGLLKQLRIPYHKGVHSSGHTCFCFNFQKACKEFSYDLLSTIDERQRLLFLKELSYWDGHTPAEREQTEYYTNLIHNAEFVKTVAHISGLYAGISTRKYEGAKYTDGYTVRVCFNRQRSFANIQQRPLKENFEGLVYCVQVPSGKILIRNRGAISVCGNCDCLSAYQIFGGTGAYVSVKNGAKDIRTIKENYEWLDSFENIIICLDGDKTGREAAVKMAEILPPKKTKIVKMPEDCKDINDFLVRRQSEAFRKLWWQAEEYRPEDIVNVTSLLDRVMDYRKTHQYMPTPWEGLNEMLQGTRAGQLAILTSGSGMGKSIFLRTWMLHLMKTYTDLNVGGLFMEESVEETVVSLMSTVAGKNLKKPTVWEECSKEELTEYFYEASHNGRIELFEPKEQTTPSYIANKIRYLAMAKGCKVIFLDHLTFLVDTSDDIRKDLNRLSKDIKEMCVALDITVIAAIHLRKSQSGKDHESGAVVRLDDIKDSSSVKQLSDIVIALERDSQNEDRVKANTTTMRVLKNRDFGAKGVACGLLYDSETTRLQEIPADILLSDDSVF